MTEFFEAVDSRVLLAFSFAAVCLWKFTKTSHHEFLLKLSDSASFYWIPIRNGKFRIAVTFCLEFSQHSKIGCEFRGPALLQ